MKLEQCADKFKAVLSYLNFTKFHEYLNKYYPSKKFSFEQEKKATQNRLFQKWKWPVNETNLLLVSIDKLL